MIKIRSSYNADRVATCCINKPRKEYRRAKSVCKTMSAQGLYTQLYGREAYQAWKCREAEISILAKSGDYSAAQICAFREVNLRQMKSHHPEMDVLSGRVIASAA